MAVSPTIPKYCSQYWDSVPRNVGGTMSPTIRIGMFGVMVNEDKIYLMGECHEGLEQ